MNWLSVTSFGVCGGVIVAVDVCTFRSVFNFKNFCSNCVHSLCPSLLLLVATCQKPYWIDGTFQCAQFSSSRWYYLPSIICVCIHSVLVSFVGDAKITMESQICSSQICFLFDFLPRRFSFSPIRKKELCPAIFSMVFSLSWVKIIISLDSKEFEYLISENKNQSHKHITQMFSVKAMALRWIVQPDYKINIVRVCISSFNALPIVVAVLSLSLSFCLLCAPSYCNMFIRNVNNGTSPTVRVRVCVQIVCFYVTFTSMIPRLFRYPRQKNSRRFEIYYVEWFATLFFYLKP